MTTDPLWLVLVLHLAPTLAAVAALIAAVKGHRAAQAIRVELNGRFDALVKQAHQEGFLKGLKEGQQQP